MAEQSSKRRASAIIAKGLISDSTHFEEGGFPELADFFVGRSGELLGRFPRQSQRTKSVSTSASNISRGCCVATFHPDMGVIGNFGIVATAGLADTDVSHQSDAYYSEYQVNAIGNLTSTRAWNSAAASADWTNLGSACLTNASAAASAQGAIFFQSEQAAETSDEVYFAEAGFKVVKWGGSNIASASVASASGVYWSSGTNIINGINTTFSNYEEGMYLIVNGAENTVSDVAPAWRITKIVDNTTLYIDRILWTTVASASRKAWVVQPMAQVTGGRDAAASAAWPVNFPYPVSKGIVAYHDGRLFLGAVADNVDDDVFNLNRIRWSANQAESDAGRVAATSTTTDASTLLTGGASGSGYFSHTDHWHGQGFVDVFPGVGGALTGMVSLNNELVIFKKNAVVSLTNQVSFRDAGNASLRIISNEVGAGGLRSFVKTKSGIFFAHKSGLHVYDGSAVKNLTAGRVQNKWHELYGSETQFVVNRVGGKIYVNSQVSSVGTNPTTMVYDTDLDTWTTVLAQSLRSVVSVSDIDDVYLGEWGFYDRVSSLTYHPYSSVDFDYLGTRSSYYASADGNGDVVAIGSTASTPTPILVASLPIGESPFTEGRLDNIYVDYQHKNRSPEHSASPAYVSATYMYGNPDLSMGTWPTETNAEATANYNTRDRAYRISVGGTNWASNVYVYLEFSYGRDTRVFGLGYDHTIRNVVQSNYVTGDG